jgi:adenylyltransferase/sulfurtransferase
MPGVRLLDVREPWEVQRAALAGATVLPMSRLQAEAASLDRGAELIVFCHHGSRSRTATDWLRAQGFRARNMAGGIDRWSREVDAAVPRY